MSASVRSLSLALALGVTAAPALAQEAVADPPRPDKAFAARTEDGRRIYDAAQFARFSPQTALDIVAQVPGFIIQTSDSDERGLGQADENVIINGARIAGKNNDAFTALGRIPAANVVRVEIVDGASLSLAGLSGQVLNLVTTETGGLTGSFKWRPSVRRAGANLLEGEVSVNGKLGAGDFTIALANDAFRRGSEGPENVTDRSGNLLFRRNEVQRQRGDRPKITGIYSRRSEAGSVFNLSGEYELFRFRESVVTERPAETIDELFSASEDEWNAEVSADYAFDLVGGRLKLIALQRLEHSPRVNAFGRTFGAPVAPPVGNIFDQVTDEGETVLRAEYGWRDTAGSDFGVNVEGAYNFLDNEGALRVRDETGEFVEVPLSGANSKVEELRGEVIGTYGRALSDRWTLQASAGGEYSKIMQSGARGQTRSFIRPKGSVTLAWRPSGDLDVSFQLERKVGQLDFFDFIASVEVSNDVLSAGNPDLVPPQSWNAQVEATQKLGAFGQATVTAYHNWFSDIVDTVPITATTEARGNLPSATQYGLIAVATLLLDPVGVPGGKIDVEAQGQRSRVRDPLLGNFRRISNDFVYEYEVEFRHDIPGTPFAYGAEIEQFDGFPSVRLDQIADFDHEAPFVSVFVEHKDVFGLTVNARLANLLDRGDRFVRTVFEDRRDGPVAFVEDRTRRFGLIFQLTVGGSF